MAFAPSKLEKEADRLEVYANLHAGELKGINAMARSHAIRETAKAMRENPYRGRAQNIAIGNQRAIESIGREVGYTSPTVISMNKHIQSTDYDKVLGVQLTQPQERDPTGQSHLPPGAKLPEFLNEE